MAEERVQNLLSKVAGKRSRVPVFVNPSRLKFYLEDKVSHCQKLTIYNPYGVPVSYRIYANPDQKDKYHVHRGDSPIITPHSYVDVFFTHLEPVESNLKISTLFLITMSDVKTKKVIGKKCIMGTLLSVCEEKAKALEQSSEDSYEEVEQQNTSRNNTNEERTRAESEDRDGALRFRMLISSAVILFLVLLLPLEDKWNSDSLLPKCLFLPVEWKSTIAFFFGAIAILLWQQIIQF